MLPQAVPEHPLPARLQLTDELVLFWTTALNCCCAPAIKFALDGETETEITGGLVVVELLLPQAMKTTRRHIAGSRVLRCRITTLDEMRRAWRLTVAHAFAATRFRCLGRRLI